MSPERANFFNSWLVGGGEHVRAELLVELVSQLGVCAQVAAGGLPALAEAHRAVADPAAPLGQQARLEAEVDQASFGAEAVVGVDFQLAGLPGRGELVLDLWVPDIRFISCDLRILMDQPTESIAS
jgi:hypothetical protein